MPTPGRKRIVRAVERAAARDGFDLDPGQRALLHRIAELGERPGARGLYVHGAPGRGKSWLADAFYAALPTERKTRVHFHGFFDALNRRIYRHLGEPDAVERAIDDLIDDAVFLLFDELHVPDSGDARLLNRVLAHVFDRGLTVFATSNHAPEDLLPDPNWHHVFEPGIALVTENMDVWKLDGPTDYRALVERHDRGFAAGSWTRVRPGGPPDEREATLTVAGRTFAVVAADDGELVATFAQLCEAVTATVEFLRWTREFPRWTITGIPSFDAVDPQAQQRFLNLVDVLVDADVRVDFSSAVDLQGFLAAAGGRPDAIRMVSRLRLLQTSPAPDAARAAHD
ncbi:cell division protein ZapE [Microbacterium sp. KR10-403]|uniref:cell division protein ZapE n=1 Tax=Microbacterium sp. KR10-403 TaxID=3158581 RepID=UPI0032E3A224